MFNFKNRPLSPHLTVYIVQENSLSSILQRISGILLYVVCYYYLLYWNIPFSNLAFNYFYLFTFYSVFFYYSFSVFIFYLFLFFYHTLKGFFSFFFIFKK
uniref:succinate:cytochrome c oxidoreductase subunit 3 n=1 Tax=Madagascaria erythrocladioides TaxID=753684 RepID=UPI001FCCEFD7|nr:succinate:cytochrome c oxidoreductase subunit 3 [Madagascaria erythrocladioides]UNJ18784.1 succinate:cytochrome c oxidoreductase subunit 3 [Madagascaria erythrocladioides]